MVTPVAIKKLLLALSAVYLLQVALSLFGVDQVSEYGALSGEKFWGGCLWQPFTSVFLHSGERPGHLLGNMFILWMFGSPVAAQIGSKRFLRLFILGGAAAGLLKMLIVLPLHLAGLEIPFLSWTTPSIGASGAVFVIFAWYCFSWPDREISLLFVPIVFTGRQALPLWFLVEFAFSGGAIDHAIHLLGALVGWLWFRGAGRQLRKPPSPGKPKRRWGRRRRSGLRVVPDDDGPVFH